MSEEHKRWGAASRAGMSWLCGIMVWLAGQGVVAPAWAQPGFRIGGEGQQMDLFRPAPRVLQQYLRRAEKAIEEQDYRGAVELLGSILTGQTRDPDLAEVQQDYFLRGFADEQHRTSIKARALKLLGELPAEGRQWYELKYGTEAAQLVRQAVSQRDILKLNEVTRKYFHTRAGYDAAVLLGRWQLDQGHPLAAALSLKRLYDVPHAAGDYEPTLSLLLAASWLRAEMPSQAVEVIVSLKKKQRGSGVTLAGRSVPWFGADSEALAWLEEHLRGAAIELHEREQQWVLFRGNPQRNGLAAGGFPLMHYRWRASTVLDPSDAEIVNERRLVHEAEDRVVLPVFQPLAVGDVVVMRTPEWVFGVNVRTGKLVWNYPWFQESLGQVGTSDGNEIGAYNSNRNKRRDELVQRLWEDAPYGQLASDGKRVFLLDEMPYALSQVSARQMMFMPNPNRTRSEVGRTNQLVACSLAEEGKLQWIVGGESGEDEPRLAGAFFLGAPLPLMGQLFVLAEINGEIRLVVLDAESGHLQWSQQIAHVAELTIERDPNRRLAGATPSFDDGILVCPTSAGACVAVDLATRSLLWGYQYPAFRSAFNRYRPPAFPQPGERWADATATLVQGAVLLTPVESKQLHCLDLLTGKPRWEPIDRDGMLFVGGVHKGVVLLVGTDRCRGISLETGEPAWESDLELGAAHPSGRGFLTGRYYYLPTTSSELLKIDVLEGRVVQSVKTDLVLGNLISYRNQIISLNVDWLSCYYQAEPLRRLVETRLKEHPDDVWALLRHSELLIHDGKQDEALATLRRAHQVAPDDEVVRELLVSTLMTALASDFGRYRELASELDELIDQPRQRLDYLRLVVDGSLGDGDVAQAWKSLRKLLAALEASHGSLLLGELSTLLRINARHKVRFDRWLAARVAEVYRKADEQIRAEIEGEVRGRLERASEDLVSLRRLFSVYLAIPIAAEVRLRLARRLAELEEGRTEAELLISDLVDYRSTAGAAVRAEALVLQIELLEKIGRSREAIPFLQRLLREHAQHALADGTPVAKWAAETGERLARSKGAVATWPSGRVEVTRSQGPTLSSSYLLSFRTKAVLGAADPGVRVQYDMRMRQIQVQDAFGRREIAMRVGTNFASSGSWPFQVAHRGHLTLVNTGFELLLLDRLGGRTGRDTLRWKDDTGTSARRSLSSYRGIHTATIQGEWGGQRFQPMDQSSKTLLGRLGPFFSHGIVYQKMRELLCVDPITGEVQWSRAGYEPGSEIFGDEEHVYVIEPDAERAIVLRTWDGQELGHRPVPPLERRWRSYQGDLITCRKVDDKLLLTRRDVWRQQDEWKLEVPATALLAEVTPSEFAIARRDGNIAIVDADTGKTKVTYQGDAISEAITKLWVMPSSQDYLVILSGETKSQGSVSYSSPMPWRCPLVTGLMLSLDRDDGKLRWKRPAKIAAYAIPLDQPPESPVLLMVRQTRGANQLRSSNSSNRPSITCLDRRFGNSLLKDEIVPRATVYQMFVDVSKNRVELKLMQRRWTFEFTDDAVESGGREPLQMELKANLRVSDAIENMGRIAEGLFKGLKGAQRKEEPKKKQEPGTPKKGN